MIPVAIRVRARTIRRLAAILALPAAIFLLLDALFPFPFERLDRPPSVVVADRDGRPLRAFLSADQKWRFPVRYAELPSRLVETVVLSEDRWFGWHPGVNPVAAIRAAWSNARAGRVVSGASTIPMQIARMADPAPRTIRSKIREAFRAVQLWWHRSDAQLVETYLNTAPYGGNIEGVGAAAYFYFGKSVGQLSAGEIALLAALPRSPVGLDPTRHPGAARAARTAVLAKMEAASIITASERLTARAEPVPDRRRPAPMEAPHFARYLLDEIGGEPVIRSTLDRAVQRAAEAVAARHIGTLRRQGVGNLSAVVIENRTHALRAMVGSAAFDDPEHQGQVNGALARRSPGSTLKPFLYAEALDDGLVIPESWLPDVPIDFSGYVAQNYDGTYSGQVTVREALTRSLNAPAVWMLSRVGLDSFLGLLRRGGLGTLDRPASEYGLPLVLGAGEVRLLDLTNLFVSLSSGGLHRPVVLLEERAEAKRDRDEAVRLFSPAAAGIVLEMLTGLTRPDLPGSWSLARGVRPVAWKTGTSFGHRDAWAVGTSGGYTIGVWIGNFDGTPVKGISGARQAGPVLMDLLRAIDREGAGVVPAARRSPAVRKIELCAVSHERPGPFCTHRIPGTWIESRSRIPECTYHRRVFVDDRTGLVVDGRCLKGRKTHSRIVERYPPEIVAWWRARSMPVPDDAPASLACAGVAAGDPPSIVSPDPSTPYRLRSDAPAGYQRIPLIARLGSGEDAGRERLFWYQEGRLLGSGPAASPFYVAPEPGSHRLVVVDDSGRTDSVVYTVER